MKNNFTYGPNPGDSAQFDVGPVTMSEQEALQMAFIIIGHFRPAMLPTSVRTLPQAAAAIVIDTIGPVQFIDAEILPG